METEIKFNEKSLTRLKDHALLAIVLSSEAPRYYSLEKAIMIMQDCNNSLHRLSNLSISELFLIPGIQKSDAIRIKAMFELSNRKNIHEVLEKPKISNSKDVFLLFQHLSDCQYEEFWIVVLNKANRVIQQLKISEGGVTGTVVDPKKVFKLALDAYACSLILIHNHPSGNIQPSEADKAITDKLMNAGKLLDIAVLDHIIIGGKQYFSFADEERV